LLALAAVMAMFLPGPLAAKDKDYLEGTILDSQQFKSGFMTAWECNDLSSGTCDHSFVRFQVEDLTYLADYEHHRGLVGMNEYKFKDEDWPVNGKVQLRFEVKHLLGLRRTFIFVKTPKGKEIRFVVYSKTGQDGKELCGKYRC
jgi:hypothetical protein